MDEAKTNLSRLAARAAAGEAVILMRGDTPIARIVPLAPEEKPRRQPGRFKGVFRSRRSLLRTAAGGRARSLEQSEVRLLLDTHAWFWWIMGSSRLPAKVASAIGSPDSDVLVSAVSV